MNKKTLFLWIIVLSISQIYAQAPQIIPANHPGIKGLWEFNNASNLLQATFGNNLTLVGFNTAISGPTVGDGAVTIPSGSYYTSTHNIPANGGGAQVNEYSLVFDFRIPLLGQWHSFYQANAGNSNDAELFINTNNQVGRSTNGPGYSSYSVAANEWYRLVVSVDLGNHYKVYLDGVLIIAGGSLSMDGEYALYPSSGQNLLHFFADNDGEDKPIDIALAAIFDHPLSLAEVASLGGYGHVISPVLTGILPYLQTPTPNSMYFSWHSTQSTSTMVQYGLTSALGLTQNGSIENIVTKKWNTVKLSGLIPDTVYYYKCISGTEESDIYQFRTPPSSQGTNRHLRFILLGDSRTDVARSTQIANAAKTKAMEMFGNDIQNQINLVVHVGDVVSSGSSYGLYEDEFFKPYACLSSTIPFMVIIGNHEGENPYYYKYMKFDDVSDYTGALAEKFYAFYYLNTQFIFINGNTTYQSSVQTSWVQQKLEQSNVNPDVKMTFCFTHQPGHSELWPDGNTPYIQNDIIPLLKQYDKVQLLAYGHSHNYERGMIESSAANSNGDFYVMLTGGAGSALDRWGMYPNQTDYEEIIKTLDYYVFNIVDIDIDNQSFDLYTYSYGNIDKPQNCELIDHYYRKLNQSKPIKPLALSPSQTASTLPLLVASQFEGVDSVFSVKFQITSTPGNYSSPVLNKRIDKINIYGTTGVPDYTPINLNANIDLRRFLLTTPLSNGQQYAWRVAYRDNNLKWSDWSDEKIFTASTSISPYTQFAANITQGYAPLSISFTDLSFPIVNTWNWDFNNDGTEDSNIQDPTFVFQTPGFYTVKLTTTNGIETKDLYINVEQNNVSIIENKSTDILRINPNPCYDKTNIEFYTSESADVKISILDVNGKEIKVLQNGFLQNGKHTLIWDLKTDNASNVSSGNYFVKMESKKVQEVKKIIVIIK